MNPVGKVIEESKQSVYPCRKSACPELHNGGREVRLDESQESHPLPLSQRGLPVHGLERKIKVYGVYDGELPEDRTLL